MLTQAHITTKPTSLYLCTTSNTLIMCVSPSPHLSHMFLFFLYLIYCTFNFPFIYWECMNAPACSYAIHAQFSCMCFNFHFIQFFCLLICDITTSHHFLTRHVTPQPPSPWLPSTPTNDSSSRGLRCDVSWAIGMFSFSFTLIPLSIV